MQTAIYFVILAASVTFLDAAELVTLTPKSWDEYAPHGKEVDCIYGDFVLKNNLITAVIAKPIPGRHANTTVHDVGGAVLDLTFNDHQNDQLTAFYPGNAMFPLRLQQAKADDVIVLNADGDNVGTAAAHGQSVELQCIADGNGEQPSVEVTYRLSDNVPYLIVVSTFVNTHDEPIEIELVDQIRADVTFEMGSDPVTKLAWWYDKWFGQAYGVIGVDRLAVPEPPKGRFGPLVHYLNNEESRVVLQPNDKYELVRRLSVGKNLIEVRQQANQIAGIKSRKVTVIAKDAVGPIAGADVSLIQDETQYANGRTLQDGTLSFNVPRGAYDVMVAASRRGSQIMTISESGDETLNVTLPLPGYVEARITDAEGDPTPCKVQFRGAGDTSDPDFGPDSGDHAVKNLYYTADGTFQYEMAPGQYDVLISHGPEYDVVSREIAVKRGETTLISASLVRTVSTPGWVSTDFHSHSSPSGDNSGSQFGRVLNLLAEHLEFAPCTEHNRISTYAPHLERLHATHLLATCPGIELSGDPLPINHQNAFPLVEKPRFQDGGGPRTHVDPVMQIERLALWDGNSDKLVQENHPRIVQILGDENLDGKADAGFKKMFGIMDVIEVHPPIDILGSPELDGRKPICRWLQLLNLGYRIPGVVNTDAHYNFHGSGWLRNYVQCPTDDPAKIKTLDIVHAAENGKVIMTNGPFMEVRLSADGKTVGVGEDIHATSGEAVLHVRVQCPNWFDVDRVQILVNGNAREELNFTRFEHADRFSPKSVQFDQKLPLRLESDSHIIVVTAGEQSALGPVMGPKHEKDRPVAVSNPIFVDVDGGGFVANGDLLGVEIPFLEDNAQTSAPN